MMRHFISSSLQSRDDPSLSEQFEEYFLHSKWPFANILNNGGHMYRNYFYVMPLPRRVFSFSQGNHDSQKGTPYTSAAPDSQGSFTTGRFWLGGKRHSPHSHDSHL
jgi:hypothetical protein